MQYKGWRMVKSKTHRDAETLVWKSETETWSFNKIRARDCTKETELVSKTVRSETWATRYSKINKYKIDKSRVPKCYAMTTNFDFKSTRLVAPTYVFNEIRNFVTVLFKTVCQKTKSETPRPRGQKFENPRRKETQEKEISRLIQNASEISKLEQKFSRPWISGVPFDTLNTTEQASF